MDSMPVNAMGAAKQAFSAVALDWRDADTVPGGVLEPPSTEDCRQILKPECAALLDGYLRRLARQESLARRVLGVLAQRLLARGDHHRLGFARIGDYARERLGISKRELQSLARTAAALAELPLTSRAFEAGRLGWTKARLIASIATPETEHVWIERAESSTAAELQRSIAVERERANSFSAEDPRGDGVRVDLPSGEADAGTNAGAHGDASADDHAGTSGATRADANAASHADRDAGTHAHMNAASRGDTDAGIDAAADDDDESVVDGEPRAEVVLACPTRVRALWRRAVELARCVIGDDLCLWQVTEVIAAEGLSARDLSGYGGTSANERALNDRGTANQRASNDRGTADERAFARHARDWGFRLAGARPDRSLRAADGHGSEDHETFAALRAMLDWSAIEEAVPDRIDRLAENVDDLTPHQIDARLREALAALQRIDWQVGRLLHTMQRMRLYRELGFRDSTTYIQDRLGISVRKARGLVAIERRCGHTTYALSEAFGCGKISWLRALLLLPVVSEQHGDAWIERARGVTLRRLAAEVEWARDLAACARGSLAVAPPPLGCRLGPEVGVVELRGAGGDTEKVQFGAPLAERGRSREEEPWVDCPARIRISGPMSVVELLMEAVSAFSQRDEAPWRGLERLLVHVVDYWSALPRHRDPVFARDGWRCAVPGCGTRRNLHDHHILFRSLGGDNDLDNRVSVCVWHHKCGIHAGLIRAHGRVGSGVTWEVGVRRGKPPLFAARDDVYVQPAS